MIDLTSEKLCDSLKIDFLTMTVHMIEPKKLLEILCKHSSVEFDKFNIVNRGSIPGYIKEFTEISNHNICTNTKKRNVQIYQVNDDNYNVATNINFGNRASSFMFRLYDKRIEQKRLDVTYWKRLEIKLRSKRSQLCYEMLLNRKSLNEVFTSPMYSCFKPLDKSTSYYSENSKSDREMAPWYKSFLDKISQLYRKCIF